MYKNRASDVVRSLKPTSTLSKTPKLTPLSIAIRASVLGLGLMHGVSQAATLEVTSHLDNETPNGLCTLREAVARINAGMASGDCGGTDFGVNDLITFNAGLASSTITLNGTELAVAASIDLNIDASAINGGITIDADQQSRVLSLGDTTVLTLDSVTVTGGSETNGGGINANGSDLTLKNSTVSGNSATLNGGGIYAYDGSVTLTDSAVSDNTSVQEGGGIYSTYNNGLSMADSTVSGNSATTGSGGGVYCTDGCDVTLSGSTVSGNSAGDAGGGIYADTSGTITITNSTISGNMSTSQGGGIQVYDGTIELDNTTVAKNSSVSAYAGGLVVNGNTVTATLNNSILADNSANDTPNQDCGLLYGTVTPDNATIIENGNCNAVRSGNPGLGNLGNNGGPTQTHTISAGSIARNTGILATCETNDQRGILRDNGDGACDVGSVEFISSDDDSIILIIPLGGTRAVAVPL